MSTKPERKPQEPTLEEVEEAEERAWMDDYHMECMAQMRRDSYEPDVMECPSCGMPEYQCSCGCVAERERTGRWM